jgi:transcriptional regulator
MHPNPKFRRTPEVKNIEFVRERSFGVLAVNSERAPLISHIPFQLSADGAYLEAHLVRVNPIVQLLTNPIEAVIAVTGGDAYISPDWYGVENQVPTWNYVAVHLRGTLKRLQNQELRGILDRLSENMENRLGPKIPWKIDKMDEDAYVRMSRQIIPIAMNVSNIEGTWKLSQNKPSDARKGAMKGAGDAQIGADVNEVVKWMGVVESD